MFTYLMLSRWVPGALEGGPRGRQQLLGVKYEDSDKVWRTTGGTLLEEVEARASLLSVFHRLRLVYAQRTRSQQLVTINGRWRLVARS